MASLGFVEALEHLRRAEVELIVVGMASAVLQGTPAVTQDIDIVHRRTPANVERLLGALASLDAVYRTDNRGIRPSASHLLLKTRAGDLGCLGTIDADLSYEDLEPDSIEIMLGAGLTCRVLELSRLIEIKQRAGRPKDLAVLPVLRATLDELRKR